MILNGTHSSEKVKDQLPIAKVKSGNAIFFREGLFFILFLAMRTLDTRPGLKTVAAVTQMNTMEMNSYIPYLSNKPEFTFL